MGNEEIVNNLINIVLNEAHVVQEWGGTFHSDYLHIGPIRYLINRKPTVGIHLRTATLPPDRVDTLKAELHLRDDTSMFRMSTDCPNIFLAVHKMQSPIGSYHDLAFVIQK